MAKPIEVTTEVVINHWELGKYAADWNSVEQGQFLHGMASGFSEQDGAGHLQVHYIVQGLPEQDLKDVRHFVEILADYFKEQD